MTKLIAIFAILAGMFAVSAPADAHYGTFGFGFNHPTFTFSRPYAVQTFATTYVPTVALVAAPVTYSVPVVTAPAPVTFAATAPCAQATMVSDPAPTAAYTAATLPVYTLNLVSTPVYGVAFANGYTYTNGFNVYGVNRFGFNRFGTFVGVHFRPGGVAAANFRAAQVRATNFNAAQLRRANLNQAIANDLAIRAQRRANIAAAQVSRARFGLHR
jgi:hypothetical protein